MEYERKERARKCIERECVCYVCEFGVVGN